MDKEADCLEEYKHLYAEIGRNSQIAQNVFVANVAVTSGLIGYGLNAGFAPIFLAPFAIIVPSLFFLASQLESTTRIAAYISVFFESSSNELNWEQRRLTLRTAGLPSKRKYTLSLSGLYGFVSIVCVLLCFHYWAYSRFAFLLVVVPVALLVVWGVRVIVRAFSLELAREYIAAWEELATDESHPTESTRRQ
ncbi:MAG: hypothetical protein ACYTFD_16040 [Planctomycetota bacterium]